MSPWSPLCALASSSAPGREPIDLTPGLDEPVERFQHVEVLEALGWERGGSAERREAAGPVGCRADVFVPFAGRAGEGSQPLGAGSGSGLLLSS